MLMVMHFNHRFRGNLHKYCCRIMYLSIGFLVVVLWFHVSAAADLPTLVDTPTLIVDQANNGTTLLTLRNPTNQILQKGGALSASDFFSTITKQQLGARLAFSAPGAQAGTPVYNIPQDMQPGSTQIVKLDVSNLWQAGESTADLKYNDQRIGTLRALKYLVPFAVSVQSATPDNPTVTLERGKPGALTLKNDDAMTYYPVHWDLVIEGKKIEGKGRLNLTRLPPKGTVSVDLDPPSPALFAKYRGLFKEDVQDGRLTLSYYATEGRDEVPLYVKTIPLKARLLYWSPVTQQLLGTGIIFIVLLSGGLCSLLVSYWVPNRLRRRDLIEQLANLVGKIRSLSQQIDSSLRVLVRVQHHRLLRMPFSRWTLSPDLATVFSQCTQGIITLNRQVILLNNVDATYSQLKKAVGSFPKPPPSLLDRIEEQLQEAQEHLANLEPQDADFQAEQTHIAAAVTRLTSLKQADPTFVQELVDRVKSLKAEFDSISTGSQNEELQEIKAKLPVPFTFLDPHFTDPNAFTLDNYETVDTNTSKLKVVRDYIRLCGTTSIDPASEKELLGHLSYESRQELQAARQVVKQISEGISKTAITDAVTAKSLSIVMDPGVARPYLPVKLSALFNRKDLDGSAARDQFTCVWDFGHDALREAGWEVSHYFPQQGNAGYVHRIYEGLYGIIGKEKGRMVSGTEGEGVRGSYQVKVSFKDEQGQWVMGADNKPVTVERKIVLQTDPAAKRHDRLGTEAIYLVIVLFAALLALIGGAREQLAKMDLVSGLIGVFVIGFTADQIKNLLTQRIPGGQR